MDRKVRKPLLFELPFHGFGSKGPIGLPFWQSGSVSGFQALKIEELGFESRVDSSIKMA
jgi:hypothetical protein